MQEINWSCCPLVAQNSITRAFIEQMAKERKSQSTIENYSRDLNDFLSAFPDIPFSELLEADDVSRLLTTSIVCCGSGKRNEEMGKHSVAQQHYPTSLDLTSHPRRSGGMWAPYAAFTAGVFDCAHRHDSLNPVREGIRGRERGLVPVPTSVPWIPDERQWKAILTHVLTNCSTRDQAIVLLAHDGALRREEIVLLRVDDIDWRTHTIAIRPEITKNKLPGTIVLSHPTWSRLKEYVEGIVLPSSRATVPTAMVPFFSPTRNATLVSPSRNGR